LAGRQALGGGVQEVAHAAAAAPPPRQRNARPDLLLEGLAAHFDRGYEGRTANTAEGTGRLRNRHVGRRAAALPLVSRVVALHLWDDEHWDLLSDRQVQLARGVGALSELPLALSSRAYAVLLAGDLTGAACLVGEIQVAMDATGSHLAPYAELGVAACAADQPRRPR